MKLVYLILFLLIISYTDSTSAQTETNALINISNYYNSSQVKNDSIGEIESEITNQLNKFNKNAIDTFYLTTRGKEKYDSITERCTNVEDTLLHNIKVLETSDFNRYLNGKVKTNTVNFYTAELINEDFKPIILLGKGIYKMNKLGQEIEVNTYSESDETPFKGVKNEYTSEGIQNKVTTYIDGELQKTEELIFKDNQSLCYKSNADVYKEEYGVIANSKIPNKILRASVEYTFKEGKLITRKKFNKQGEESIINRYFYDKENNMTHMEESIVDDNPRIITFKYLSKDDKGNWTKCYLTNTQNGEIQHQLIITRELEYY